MIKSLLLLLAVFVDDPAHWPTFLGQGASYVDPSSIPLAWSPTENIAWKSQLPGKGQSSPVIWGDKVIVTCIEGSMKDTCHVIALSLNDGKELWRQSVPSAQPVRSTYTQTRSAPTPAVDSKGIYAFFETGNVLACSHDGQIQWQRDLTEDYGLFESTIGLASSPTVFEDKMILLIDHEGPSYLLALDTSTGESKWITERTSRTSYSSPVMHKIAGMSQIVCSSSGSIDGYDPFTGEMLWTYEDNIGGNRSGAALPASEGVFTISGSPGMHNEREAEARNTNLAMKVELVGGRYEPKVLWQTTEAMPAFNSPMTHQNLSYWVTKAGVVFCYNSKTGEKVYAKRACGTCWATPVAIGDRVYLFGKDGTTVVIAAGPEFKVLSENQLWDPEEFGTDTGPGRGSMASRSRGNEHSQEHDSTPGKAAKENGSARDSTPDNKSPSSKPNEVAQTIDEKSSATAPTEETRFADPVQYGVAMVSGNLIIRTGGTVFCIRNLQAKP